ncbi:putative methyltransferase-domain-containing protein [Russula ochroleuca]|uniref:Methyltransferase-domain-containing protein n=1 Tax=Russula ochroleuca TaxID=152965 RepID=A0A9P5MRK0_9AGAM|nr:putative methyltransferase-domain-containing protein [Russula ochroleuca]
MFFYFSFLRTPPQSGSQSSSVVFTPQVTNDLRTEPYPSSIDIFYWWISYTPQNVTRLSEPAKLTTWRQENAYKPLQIPPPSKKLIGAAAEIDCSLVLTPAPSVTSSVIDLRDPEIGRVPLPVCSLPIRISVSPQQQQRRDVANTTTTKSPKQEAITRSFRLFDDDGDAIPLMQIQETISFDLDKKLWDSGIGLSAWLVHLSSVKNVSAVESSIPSEQQPAVVPELKERLFGSKECHIIELGAGTGIVSLALAALRSVTSSTSQGFHDESCILSTDLPSSMELMSYNIRTNAALYPNCAPTSLPLDWDEELPETVQNVRERGGFDLVVMADVTYNTSSFPALLQTLASLLALSAAHHVADDADDGPRSQEQERDDRGHNNPLVLLAYKERDPAERQLWDMMARETGVVLECVGKQAGAGGLPVEIWLGKRRI